MIFKEEFNYYSADKLRIWRYFKLDMKAFKTTIDILPNFPTSF